MTCSLQFVCTALIAVCLLFTVATPLVADEKALLEERGSLLFADDFNRDDGSAVSDAPGNGWTSNSAWRAEGSKQVFLNDGTLRVATAPGASHGATMFHDIEPAFADSVVQIRFLMAVDEAFILDFNDPQCDVVHAGHIVKISVSKNEIVLKDSKTGDQNREIKELRRKNQLTPEILDSLAAKSVTLPCMLADGKWHTMYLIVEGDLLRVTIDGKDIGQIKSEGIAHPTKRKICLGAKKSPQLDDFKVWMLKSPD
jgi:hypothetical protein